MIHHVSIGVSEIIASGSFYDAILEPLGYARVFEEPLPCERHQAIGYEVVPNEDAFTIKKRVIAPRDITIQISHTPISKTQQ